MTVLVFMIFVSLSADASMATREINSGKSQSTSFYDINMNKNSRYSIAINPGN